jgi:ABC-type dipeptide/oligopeptide/nickel transport system permease subunit
VTAARLGTLLLVIVGLAAIGAPWLSTSDVSTHHPDLALASPSLTRRALVDRLPPTYRTLDERLPLEWFAGTLVRSADPAEPLLPLGSDSLGRDQWTRLLHGARLSLGLTLAGLTGALGIGTLLGLLAGSHGGWLDSTVMRMADLLLAWPALYVVLVLRAALPLSLPFASLFALMAVVLTLSGWPIVARAVRSVTATERTRESVLAARAAGSSGVISCLQRCPSSSPRRCCSSHRSSSPRRPCRSSVWGSRSRHRRGARCWSRRHGPSRCDTRHGCSPRLQPSPS